MSYFVTSYERKLQGGTCYFEFQKGSNEGEFWVEDSIYLYAEIFDKLKLHKLFTNTIPHFYYYGITKVNKEAWKKIYSLSKEFGGRYEEAMDELKVWADECFKTEDYFIICGI